MPLSGSPSGLKTKNGFHRIPAVLLSRDLFNTKQWRTPCKTIPPNRSAHAKLFV